MDKKIKLQALREHIRKLVKEEVQKIIKEDVNPHLARIRDKKALSAWLMRQYFNPSKHSDKIWYSPDVTEDNVLEFVSNSAEKGLFPLTPKEVAELWKLKKQLGSSLGQISDEELSTGEELEPEPEEETGTKYEKGEEKLRTIAKELGDVTPTMINKIGDSAKEKFSKLHKGKNPSEMSEDELEELNRTILNARAEAAREFATTLKSSKTVEQFLDTLLKNQILAPTDIKIIEPQEVEGLSALMNKSNEVIEKILLRDIENDRNIFKSFQSAVSKKVFPPGKRGRPAKVREEE